MAYLVVGYHAEYPAFSPVVAVALAPSCGPQGLLLHEEQVTRTGEHFVKCARVECFLQMQTRRSIDFGHLV